MRIDASFNENEVFSSGGISEESFDASVGDVTRISSGVDSVNGRKGVVTVREVPDHGILGQVLTVTGNETYDWRSLPVWDGTIE